MSRAPRRAPRWIGSVMALIACAGWPMAVSASPEPITNGAASPKNSPDTAIFRGGLVYANYCVTCHGINADGNGRTARLYSPRPANLRATDKNADYVELIVRKGGEAIGRSDKMPPWGEELTDEQIRDVVFFVKSFAAKS